MSKAFMLADVKATSSEDPNGTFEAVISAPTLDRDGEVIEANAFAPLPKTIPIHAFHNFDDPVAVAEPFYDGYVLKATGRFASTTRAQEVRQLVVDGVIETMSVGFRDAKREMKDGVPYITSAELLEASFVSIPANREALVLSAKEFAEKVGVQQAHDLAVSSGAVCDAKHDVTVEQVAEAPQEAAVKAAAPAVSDAHLLLARAMQDAVSVL